MSLPEISDGQDEPFRGSELSKTCRFCAIIERVDEEKIAIAGSGDATAFMSKKDGHPLVVPLTHIEGDEKDPISDLARRAAWEWALDLFPYVDAAYKKLYGATGTTILANTGSQQNVKHYHIHIQGYRGTKENPQEIVITDPWEKAAFAEEIVRSMDLGGILSNRYPEPTHW